MRRPAAAALALAALAIPGCGEERGDRGLSVIPEASLDYALPGDTLAEWARYGDQLSVVRVTAETPPDEWPAYKDGGGLVGRTVSAEIERTPWRRAGAPRVPGARLRFGTWGWMYDDDQDPESPRAPLVSEGSARIEVGRRYLVLLTRHRGEWGPLRDSAVLTLGDGRVTSEVAAGDPSPAAVAVRGRTVPEAAAMLASAPGG